MSLKPEYDGDVTKVPGAFLAVARGRENGEFIGFYALTDEGTYIRGARSWITASGAALGKLNGAQLVEMRKSFITFFDVQDSNNGEVTDSDIANFSTAGNPSSWDSQQ